VVRAGLSPIKLNAVVVDLVRLGLACDWEVRFILLGRQPARPAACNPDQLA
jgi:hypothetical protein